MDPRAIDSAAEPLGDIIKTSFQFRGRTSRVKSNPVNILEVRFAELKNAAPYMIVKSSVIGASEGAPTWNQTLHLINPKFATTKRPGFSREVLLKGELVYMKRFGLETPVRLNCNCPDHRHRFHWNNADVKSHVGRRIPYTKKTDRPIVNPDKPGHCKHLIALLETLALDPRYAIIEKRVVSLA